MHFSEILYPPPQGPNVWLDRSPFLGFLLNLSPFPSIQEKQRSSSFVLVLFHVFPSPCPSPAPSLASSFFGSPLHSYLLKLAYTEFLCYPKFLFCFSLFCLVLFFKPNMFLLITLWGRPCFNKWPSEGGQNTENLLRFCGRKEVAPSIKVQFGEVRDKSLYRSFNCLNVYISEICSINKWEYQNGTR